MQQGGSLGDAIVRSRNAEPQLGAQGGENASRFSQNVSLAEIFRGDLRVPRTRQGEPIAGAGEATLSIDTGVTLLQCTPSSSLLQKGFGPKEKAERSEWTDV